MGENLEFKEGSTAYSIMQDFDKAISLNQETPEFFQYRAELNYKLEKGADAISDYNMALKLNPENEQGN